MGRGEPFMPFLNGSIFSMCLGHFVALYRWQNMWLWPDARRRKKCFDAYLQTINDITYFLHNFLKWPLG